MSTKLDGAQAGISDERASIDLAWAASQVASAIEEAAAEGSDLLKVAGKNGRTLIFDTDPIIAKMLSNSEFLKDSETRFLKGVHPPQQAGRTLKVGGRIRQGSETAFKNSLQSISRLADDLIREALSASGTSARDFWTSVADAPTYLKSVAGQLQNKYQPDASVQMTPLAFADAITATAENMVARQVTSFEVVSDGNRLDQIMKSAERFFVMRKKQDPEDVEEDVEGWRANGALPGSYVDRLINFLDDEGLSRVRSAVSFRIMRALADAAEEAGGARDLVRYIRRLDDLFARLVETRAESLLVELSSLFGPNGVFDLGDMLSKASTCRQLAVWAIWDAQLFERHSPNVGDSGVQREVCYHFRANGFNPHEEKSTFMARVDTASEALREASVRPRSKSYLGELLLYDAVLRDDDVDPVVAIAQRMKVMEGSGDRNRAVRELQIDLAAKEMLVSRIASQLISVLRIRQSAKRIAAVIREPISYFVNVTDAIVNRNAVGSATDHPFILAVEGEEQKIKWLQCLRITSGTSVTGGNDFFSFKVTVQIGDRALVGNGEKVSVPTSRLVEGRVALMNLLPKTDDKAKHQESVNKLNRLWRDGRNSIVILYNPRQIAGSRKEDKNSPSGPRHSRLSASRAALLILLQVVAERIIDAMSPDRLRDHLILYRHQLYPKQKDSRQGWLYSSEAIYAMSQALEHALGKKLRVKLQGTVASHISDPSSIWRLKKSFDAVMSGFDIKTAISGDAGLRKVGIVSFASRPCDIDDSTGPSEQDLYVVAGKSYLLDPCPDGTVLRRRANILDTYNGDETVKNPSIVKEVVQDLVAEGCSNIVLLAHKYAGRSIGRSASRHRHHENVGFLTELGRSFPGVIFHPVVRDTMKVVRVSEQGRDRVGFEIIGKEAHSLRNVGSDMKESFNAEGLIPFYSLATLHVVQVKSEKGHRAQSGITTYYTLNPHNADGLDILIGNTGLMTTGSADHRSIIAALRGIHLIESEEGAMNSIVKPVLEPSSWMSPSDINGAGEIKAMGSSRNRSGTVEMSLTAISATVSKTMRSIRDLPRNKDTSDE